MGKPARVTVSPRQSLGQNFLVDDNIARNIIRELHLTADDVVIEIGPGHGALTRHLVGKVDHVIAVEIDKRVIDELKASLPASGIEILHGDFLEVQLEKLYRRFDRRLRVVGNIPYHLTSPILFKVFSEHAAVRDITIMIQREVAQRLMAQPSTKLYGIPTVFTRFYGVPKILFNVSPNCFYPKPKVRSTVIRIALHEDVPYIVNNRLFSEIVRTTFGKRRKVLRNSLQYLNEDPATMKKIARGSNPVLDKRPEQLRVEDFAALTNYVEAFLSWQKT